MIWILLAGCWNGSANSMPVSEPSKQHRCVLVVALCLLLIACEPPPAEPIRFYAFGTIIEITLPAVSANQKAAVEPELIAAFQHWQQHWHPWQAAGTNNLAAVNRSLKSHNRAELDPEIKALINAARPYYQESDGLFDPAIGGLVKLWGFNQDKLQDTPPTPAALSGWLNARPRYSDLRIDNDRLISDNAGLQLDFGAFAKGYALEQVATLLKSNHIESALINAGGDLIALGRTRPDADARAWHIGIRHPRKAGVLAELELKDGEALVTSGDYERYFIHDRKRYHHILDPRSGRPADRSIAVSVIHTDAARADVAATALFVAGPGHWRAMAEQLQIKTAMLIDSEGHIHLTDTMQERLQFKSDPAAGIETTP